MTVREFRHTADLCPSPAGETTITQSRFLHLAGLPARSNSRYFFFFSSRRRHTRLVSDWSSDVCSSDLLEGVAVCAGLLLGGGLWAAAISVAVRLCRNLYLVFLEYREFFRPFWFRTNGAQVEWFLEIWPMQWRLGVSGLVTYFLNSLYNPVMFHYHGADVAGQTGITLQVITGLSIVAMSWITTKVPRFGAMIAQKQYAELDMLWQRVSLVSLAMITIGATAVWLTLYFGKAAGFGFVHRMLDPLPTAIFLIAAVVAQFVQCLVYYLRAHKREPIMVASVSICLGTGLLVWLLGKRWGPVGAASGN